MKKYSGILSKVPVEIGRPDFVVESYSKITCIMDAKCKTGKNLSIDDLQRFLSYMLDYVYPNKEQMTGIIFYLDKEKMVKKIRSKNCKLYLISMAPSSYDKVKEKVKQIIYSSL